MCGLKRYSEKLTNTKSIKPSYKPRLGHKQNDNYRRVKNKKKNNSKTEVGPKAALLPPTIDINSEDEEEPGAETDPRPGGTEEQGAGVTEEVPKSLIDAIRFVIQSPMLLLQFIGILGFLGSLGSLRNVFGYVFITLIS